MNKPAIHEVLLNAFEKAILKVYGESKVTEVDSFIEKFKKKN